MNDAAQKTAAEDFLGGESEKDVLAKQRQEQLAMASTASRNRLAQMVDEAPSFMAELEGPDHRITLANKAYIKLAGGRDVMGKTVAETLHEATDQSYLNLLDEVYQTGKPYAASGAKYALTAAPDALPEEHFVDFIYQPIRDAGGKITGIFVNGFDSTAQTLAAAELRQTSIMLRAIIETTPNVIYAKDVHGRMQIANNAALELIGKGWEEVKNRTDAETLSNQAEAEIVMENDQMVMRSGVTQELEEWVRTGDTPPRLFLSAKSPMRDDAGNVIGLVGISVDITGRRAAELAAMESAAQFETFAQAMANQVWTSAPDGELDWFNFRTMDYAGMSNAQLAGHGWTSIVHPDDLPPVAALWQTSIATGCDYETEFRLRRHDGAYRWHLVRAVAMRGADGKIRHWIGTNTDMNDQKTTTQALADLNATLEQQVQERTAELMAAEETLRQSQKMEAVGQLTGGLAHDFNNLLAGISGSLEIMETRIAQGRTKELERYINMAQGAAKRAAALTHRLLAFSSRQTLDPKPTDINRLVADMDDLIRRTVGPAVTVEAVRAAGLWRTLVDPHQLENALLNLCINARDAMPDGGRITIETANRWLDQQAAQARDVAPGQYISLCVSDTGTGMTAEVIERAFDPFFTTKPLGTGTGLGLSMVYGFARQSGGQVRIYSELGQGSMICLYLPRLFGAEEQPEAQPEITQAHQSGQGETVLVVDDEPAIRMLVTEVLEELGYHALEAENGKDGLKILESKQHVDLLITDVGLPGGMNGRQLADAALVALPKLKIMFITGYAENAVIGDGHLRPGMHVITKPFAMEALASRIKSVLAEN